MNFLLETLWYFVIYSFLGWVTEVSFQTIKKKTFVNRGFLNGPYCPVYGFGMVLILILLSPIKNNVFLLFIGALLLTSILEFFTGLFLEKIFNKKWWDYSKEPYNLKGYIALVFSIRWGIGVVFIFKFIHPLVDFLLKYINNILGNFLLVIFLSAILIDFIFTVYAILNIQKNFVAFEEIINKLEEYSDQIGFNIYKKITNALIARENIKEKLVDPPEILVPIIDKYEALVTTRSSIQKRLEKAYPNLKKYMKLKREE